MTFFSRGGLYFYQFFLTLVTALLRTHLSGLGIGNYSMAHGVFFFLVIQHLQTDTGRRQSFHNYTQAKSGLRGSLT